MMNHRRPAGQAPTAPAGLCTGCSHVQLVTSARGATFYLCRLSAHDSRFPRYPPVPVLVCPGFCPPEGAEAPDGG